VHLSVRQEQRPADPCKEEKPRASKQREVDGGLSFFGTGDGARFSERRQGNVGPAAAGRASELAKQRAPLPQENEESDVPLLRDCFWHPM
jgi:hypothetical protein